MNTKNYWNARLLISRASAAPRKIWKRNGILTALYPDIRETDYESKAYIEHLSLSYLTSFICSQLKIRQHKEKLVSPSKAFLVTKILFFTHSCKKKEI